MDTQGDDNNNSDIDDIYDDFADFDLGKIVEKSEKENKALKEHVKQQEISIKKLADALKEMQKVNETLTENLSTLYRTAKSEVERKDGIIADLRSQRDNTAFRRRGGQIQTFTNNNSNVQKVDDAKHEVISGNVKNEVISCNVKNDVIDTTKVSVPCFSSNGEMSDKDVHDVTTDIEIGERPISEKYSKQTRENRCQEGSFSDTHINNGSSSRYNMFQRRRSNYREPEYQNYSGKFNTVKENDVRRHTESDSKRYKEVEIRRNKEIDTRRLKDHNKVDTYRQDFYTRDVRNKRDREIGTRRPKSHDGEDARRQDFHTRDVRNERDREIGTRRHKSHDREDEHRQDFNTRDVKNKSDREIGTRRPKSHDREEVRRQDFHTRDVRNERDREIGTRRHKSHDREDVHGQDFHTRDVKNETGKDLDTIIPKDYDREDTHRDDFYESEVRNKRDKSNQRRNEDVHGHDFHTRDVKNERDQDHEIIIPKVYDREDTHRDDFYESDVRNKRDKSNHRRNENISFDGRKNEENKRALIRHNPRRDSSSYLSPTRRRHKSESEKNQKKSEQTLQEKKRKIKRMLKMVSKLERQHRSHTPPLALLSKEENQDEAKYEIVPKRTEPIKNFFTDHLDNILESIHSNVHEQITNSNQQKPNTKLQLETEYRDDNFSQEEISKMNNEQKEKRRRRKTITELNSLFEEEPQNLPIDNEGEANDKQSKEKHKKREIEVETSKSKIKSKKKSKLGVLEQELELTSITNEISFELNKDFIVVDEVKNKKLESKENDADSKELVADDSFSKNEKLETENTQKLKENQHNIPVSDSIEKVKDYDVEFASPLKRYMKKCQEQSKEGTRFEIKTQQKSNENISEQNLEQGSIISTSEDSNINKEKMISEKKRHSKELEDILDEDIDRNSEHNIEGTKTKRKRKSKDTDDNPHQAIKKSKLLKIISPRKSFSPLENIYNKEDEEEILNKKNRRFKQLKNNFTKEVANSKMRRMSKTIDDNLDDLNKNPKLKSPKKGLIIISKDDKNYEEKPITKSSRRSTEIKDDSFKKNSTFAVVSKKKGPEDDDKSQKESPIKIFNVEEISNSIIHKSPESNKNMACNKSQNAGCIKLRHKKKNNSRVLDQLSEYLTAAESEDKQAQNVSNETQVQELDERIEQKKISSPRGTDKLLEEILTNSPLTEEICEKTNKASQTNNKLGAENQKLETKTNNDSAQIDAIGPVEETNKNISSTENSPNEKKIVIVSDILLHSGQKEEHPIMETETINEKMLRENGNENGKYNLPVHLNLPNLIELDTILKASKDNSKLEREEMCKTKLDLPNVNRKLKSSKSISRKDIFLERYASEESQSKINNTCSESLNTHQAEESLITINKVPCISTINTEDKSKKRENLEHKINNIRKIKGPEEAPAVSDVVSNINPKKRRVDFKLNEIKEENFKEKQIDEVECKLQLMHSDLKICTDNIKIKDASSSAEKKELKEQHTKINKAQTASLKRGRSKSTSVAVRKSPRKLMPKTPELQKSCNKHKPDISVVENSSIISTISSEDKDKLKEGNLEISVTNKKDELNKHKFSNSVLVEIKTGPEYLEINSDKTDIGKAKVFVAQKLDFPNISSDNKLPILEVKTQEQKITVNSSLVKQTNAHHLPPPLGNIPVMSTSSPIGQLPKARKRITPTRVKDEPVCSFQNILEKNNSEFKIFSKNLMLEADLNLTDDGEIPILHLEENHFNNMEDVTQKTFDKSIMKLLDCMNVSNLDGISKINEKVEVERPALNNSLTFENVIGKVPNDNITSNNATNDVNMNSTTEKNQIQPQVPVSSILKVACNEQTLTANVGTVVDKSEIVQSANIPNTNVNDASNASVQGPVRFRRRCRIIAVRKV